jgi:hypothetical protein
MVDSDSEEQPKKKKKAMKKLMLAKPNTRSACQQFRSDADKVTALTLLTLEAQLEGNEEIPQVEIEDLRTEIRGTPQGISQQTDHS